MWTDKAFKIPFPWRNGNLPSKGVIPKFPILYLRIPTAECNASLNPPGWWEEADDRGSLFFFFFQVRNIVLRHFKRKGRRSNLSKNSKQVFGRGQADKWKGTSSLQLQSQYPDWVNQSGWSKKNLRVEKKNSHDWQICSILQTHTSHPDERQWEGCWSEGLGSLAEVSRSQAWAGGIAGSRVSLLGFEPNTTAEQLWGFTDWPSFLYMHFLIYKVSVTEAPAVSGCEDLMKYYGKVLAEYLRTSKCLTNIYHY